MIAKDEGHSSHKDLWVLLNICARRRRDENDENKKHKVSIVQAHSQGSFLLMNPSIPTSCLALVVL